jgi:hypothetical protein
MYDAFNLTSLNPLISPTLAIYTNSVNSLSIITLSSLSGGGQIRVDDNTSGLALNDTFGQPIRLQKGYLDGCVVNPDRSVNVHGNITCSDGNISMSDLSTRIASLDPAEAVH